jgi:hypothetical protein
VGTTHSERAAHPPLYRGPKGRNGGPALVSIDILDSRWKKLLSLGAVDSAAVSELAGHSQAFVPNYLIGLFNILKSRFSFIELTP